MGNIRVYGREEKVYSKLKFLASTIEWCCREVYNANVTIEVEETYFDFGQDWEWTTLIAYRGDIAKCDSYQMLYPTHMDKIVNAKDVHELTEIAYDIIANQKELLTKGH